MIIAIDGPAASGKGTLARRLAAYLGFRHLDSGGLYRAVAQAVLDAGAEPTDAATAARLAAALDPAQLDDPRLRCEATGNAASQVARHPEVRDALLSFQRAFAQCPPGVVIDGRDIGTVVCPDADVKIFLTASPAVRAERRARELEERGETVDRAALAVELAQRDAQDARRTIAPLKQAADAVLLDTSDLDIEAALAAALDIVEAKRTKR